MSISSRFKAWKSIIRQGPPPPPPTGRTGFDLLGSDKELQSHWVKRIVAIIIDSIIIGIPAFLLTLLIAMVTIPYYSWGVQYFGFLWGFNWWIWILLLGIIEILYFAFLESFYGWSLGKKFMGLKVTTIAGKKPDMGKAIIRLTRIRPRSARPTVIRTL